MKQFYTLVLIFTLSIGLQAQLVFQSNFENWTDGNPDGWMGDKISITPDSVVQISSGAVFGNNACQLRNPSDEHKRFTTQHQNVVEGQSYEIKFWVKGEGEIRTGIYDSDWHSYNSYIDVNSNDWAEYTQIVTSASTWDSAEFIISVRNTVNTMGYLQLDSVVITEHEMQLTDATIYEIQFTTNPGGDSPLVDKIVTTHGIVTAVDDESFYMQDGQGEWNGIFVYQSGNNPLIGDQINIEALVEEYFGLTELKSVVNFEIISNGNTITPDMIDVPQANSEDWEGSFVQVENVSCTEAPDQYGAWIVELEFSIKK